MYTHVRVINMQLTIAIRFRLLLMIVYKELQHVLVVCQSIEVVYGSFTIPNQCLFSKYFLN